MSAGARAEPLAGRPTRGAPDDPPPTTLKFFLLSGFSIGAIYGGVDAAGVPGLWDWKRGGKAARFYSNRVARVLPAYWFWNLAAVPLSAVGFGHVPIAETALMVRTGCCTALGITTWGLGDLVGLGGCSVFNGPSWFVATLVFCYLATPPCMELLRRLADAFEFGSVQHALFYVQLALGAGLMVATRNFTIATMTPWSRLPLYLMGLAAGMQARHNAALDVEEGGGEPRAPPSVPLFLCGPCTVGLPAFSQKADGNTARAWAARVDATSAGLLVGYAVWAVLDSARWIPPAFSGNLWMQLLGPVPFLVVVAGLTRDEGLSATSRVLKTRAMRWLGGVSLQLYLAHEVFLGYFTALYRQSTWDPALTIEYRLSAQPGDLMPVWGFLAVVPASLLVAAAATPLFEALRQRMRAKRQ